MAEAFENWSERQYSPGSSATRSFLVTDANDPQHALNTVAAQYQIAVNAFFPWGTMLRIPSSGITVAADKGPRAYKVTANYSYTESEHEDKSSNPLEAPAEVEWLPGETSEEVDRDIPGNTILNAAGDIISPPLTGSVQSLFFVVKRYESKYLVKEALKYMRRTNANEFTIYGFGPVKRGQVRCSHIAPAAPLRMVSDIQAIETIYKFEIREDCFKQRVLNQGRNGFASINGSVRKGRITMQDESGKWVETSDDVLLDRYGKPVDTQFKIGTRGATPVDNPQPLNLSPEAQGEDTVTDPAIGYEITSAGAVYLHYRTTPEIDYGPLILAL